MRELCRAPIDTENAGRKARRQLNSFLLRSMSVTNENYFWSCKLLFYQNISERVFYCKS